MHCKTREMLYQPLYPQNNLLFFTMLYGMNSYEAPSRLVAPLSKSTPSYLPPPLPCFIMVFVNTKCDTCSSVISVRASPHFTRHTQLAKVFSEYTSILIRCDWDLTQCTVCRWRPQDCDWWSEFLTELTAILPKDILLQTAHHLMSRLLTGMRVSAETITGNDEIIIKATNSLWDAHNCAKCNHFLPYSNYKS